jgi:hypothetical protein
MGDKNTGGAAFPSQPIMKIPHGVELVVEQGGMTLRDYFAAKALQGICVNSGRNGYELDREEQIAARAYLLADAMLKAREA